MTFSMTVMDRSARLALDAEDEENAMSSKEIEEEKKREKDEQAKKDDIALAVCMVVILLITVLVIIFKVVFINQDPDPNISTFRPLDQMIGSNIRYNGNGYMPCNGYVPCQPEHLRPDLLAERMDGAMPCHNYKGFGESPKGCW